MACARIKWCAGLAFATLLLASCGGDRKGSDSSAPEGTAPPRGSLLQGSPQLVTTLTAVGLAATLGLPGNASLLALSGNPVCDVLVYHLDYHTVGGQNENTTASGALFVPTGVNANCRGARPLVLYAHGTNTSRAFNMADTQNSDNAEGLLLVAIFATQGYIVVAPNYAGYDTSTLGYHPYLNGDAQSKDMIDALTAARSAMPAAGLQLTKDSGRLFITGYSQGGYVAMATQRAMQNLGMTVTAAAPMSGPYALAAFFDAVASGEVNGGAPVSTTLLVSSYQHSYGNIYSSPSELFEPQYAAGIETLLPGTMSRSELYAMGKLPQSALFSSTPPAPQYASITPATQPASLAVVFAQGFGIPNLLTNDFRLRYLRDANVHPDGGWPTATTNMPATGSELPWRQALVRNDLRNWMPTSPTLLCGGDGDPVVFWLNTQLILAYWASRQPPVGVVTTLDLEAPAVAADPYAGLKNSLSLAKALVASNAVLQGASDLGRAAVLDAYHSTLVAPFCLAAVRDFFAKQ